MNDGGLFFSSKTWYLLLSPWIALDSCSVSFLTLTIQGWTSILVSKLEGKGGRKSLVLVSKFRSENFLDFDTF